MKKLKAMKNFTPLEISDGDEYFLNGIFKFNITKMIFFIKENPEKFPVEEVELDSIRHFSSKNLDEETIKTADLKNPIILAQISPVNFNVIDGNHRFERATRDGVKKLPCYRIYPPDHIAFLMNEFAYKKYIEYWNDKLLEVCRN